MEKPLVSIVVITYNSEKYVLETLESAKAQTYQNIELIISDDGSQDNTIEICQEWLEENKSRFSSSKLITVEKNTGIPANCNRGVNASLGEWIKIIAGDDVLINNSIEEVLKNISTKKKNLIIQTFGSAYIDVFEEKNKINTWKPSKYNFFNKTPNNQFKLLKYKNFLHAPSVIYHKSLFNFVSFDEQFPKVEDYPFWILVTKQGFQISFLNVETVKYRVHADSVQNLYNKQFGVEHIKFSNTYKNKYYPNYKYSTPYFFSQFYIAMDKFGMNNKSFLSSKLYLLIKKSQNLHFSLINKYFIRNK